MIVLVSQLLEAAVLGAGLLLLLLLLLLAVAGVWMIREDLGPDIDTMRDRRRRDRGAL